MGNSGTCEDGNGPSCHLIFKQFILKIPEKKTLFFPKRENFCKQKVNLFLEISKIFIFCVFLQLTFFFANFPTFLLPLAICENCVDESP